ncbi:hypothetical protein Cni_G04763 [Canna indica]|uniref:Uncharacterized protein n=1 Tax=Canna indica TaxID=4628 RepID=A0AAQ3JWG8_9LILI|nr:hypothetical protein Cni_G04763 [Canna indica]
MLLSFPPTLRPTLVPAAGPRPAPPLPRRRALLPIISAFHSQNGGSSPASSGSNPVLVAQSAPPPFPANLGLRRDPELGFFSLIFVMSMAVGSFVSLSIISLPALLALKRLAVSAEKLSKVVSEEVPGTLSSLKLSGLEINDLTLQLNVLKQRITGKQHGKRARKKPSSQGGREMVE